MLEKILKIIIFIVLCFNLEAQPPIEYFKGLRNTIQLESCGSNRNVDKNSNIYCLDSLLNQIFDSILYEINVVDFDSINNGNYDIFKANCQLRYSQTGLFLGAELLEINTIDKKQTKVLLPQIEKLIRIVNEHFSTKYNQVYPAFTYSNENISSRIPIKLGVMNYNGKLIFKYYNIADPRLIDYYDYKNPKEVYENFIYIYRIIENEIDTGFKSIAKKNGIDSCYAHILFELDEEGELISCRNAEYGDPLMEKFLIESLENNKSEIRNNFIPVYLIDGTIKSKRYFMSFKFGY